MRRAPDATIYARPEVDQNRRAKYVAHLIDQLRGLETETDPKGGAQSAKGKNLAALEALGIASTLVKVLAGWALDHQAALALKGVKHVGLVGKKLSEGSDHSSRPATDDDHRHEWYGRIWGGRLGEPIDPIVARRWLIRLVRANSGIFELELMLHTLTALEACDYGEITPMLMATKKGRKVNWTMLRLQQRALSFVDGLVGHGMKKESALEQVAKAYVVGANTVRSWKRRLDVEFGDDAVANSRKIRKRGGVRDSDSKDGPASIRLARLERDLLENGRRYIAETEKKRAKRSLKA